MDLTSGGTHLIDYWHILGRRRWVIYLALLTCGLGALIGSFLITPQYRASTTLHIERQSPDILTFRDLGQVDYSWAAYGDFYQTQYKILSSPAVGRATAERLGLVSHPDFTGEGKSPGLLARVKSWIPRRKSNVVADPLDTAGLQVLAGLDVTPVRNSQLVQVSWVAEDPELAAEVANAVAEAYIAFTIESQFATTDQAREFLVDQIGLLRREVDEIETQLQRYGESKRIVSIDDSSNITMRTLQDMADRLTEARTTLARAEARYRSVTTVEAEAIPEVLQSDLIARLRQEYATYEAEYSQKSRRFKDNWPGMQNLQSKLDRSRERLEIETERIARQVRSTAETAYREAQAEVDNLEELLFGQEEAAQQLRRDSVEFANLQQEVTKKRETLNSLLRRQGEMALSSRLRDMESTSTNIRIVEKARPPMAPFKPSLKRNLTLGVLLGLMLGVGMAFLLDYLDNTINSPTELGRVVDLPLLAAIPRQADADKAMPRGRRRGPVAAPGSFDLITHRDARSPAAEAYRELRTSILLSHAGQPPRRLIVTSALPEEGKTATAINLAVVLAQLGRRVVLVDTDLRRPRLHRAFGVENRRGVSTFLSGMESNPETLLVSTGIDGLALLPSGPIPPNPSELLNSDRFRELGDLLIAHRYQHIVFDSPPVLSVSDPVIIGSVVDGGVLVTRAGRTPRQSVRLAAERFSQAGVTHLGMVLNDLDIDSHDAKYRYRYYGRYGETPSEESSSKESRAGGVGA